VALTSSLLGTGTADQPGTLAAAAGAVAAAPQAVQEFDSQVVLPAVKEFAEGVVTVAKDAQVQVGWLWGKWRLLRCRICGAAGGSV
jgi:hypothetical protein